MRRLFEVLASQGMAANQAVTFLTDGAGDVRDLPLYLNPDSEHLIDWFHITMRLTVLAQLAKGPADADLADRRGPWCTDLDDDDLRHRGEDVARVPRQLDERLKWFPWHGNTFRALQVTDDLASDLEILHDVGPEYAKLHKAVREFGATSPPTPGPSPTTASATGPGKPSPPPSPNPWSTRSSPNAWSKSSRCAGPPAGPT